MNFLNALFSKFEAPLSPLKGQTILVKESGELIIPDVNTETVSSALTTATQLPEQWIDSVSTYRTPR